jgi:uncharacterized protein (DUF1697 family)
MMTRCIALLRGINVGRAKRIAMADLRALIEEIGFSEVRTLLNSGNAVFRATRPDSGKIPSLIEVAILNRFGHAVPVIVITAQKLKDIVAENPLLHLTHDTARLLVAFAATPAALARAGSLLSESWAPDALAVGDKAAYLWCANGIIESKLMQAFARATGQMTTTRNWTTVLKLQTATGAN